MQSMPLLTAKNRKFENDHINWYPIMKKVGYEMRGKNIISWGDISTFIGISLFYDVISRVFKKINIIL